MMTHDESSFGRVETCGQISGANATEHNQWAA